MDATRRAGKAFEDLKVNVKFRLAALWSVLMLIYIYVDIFSLYKPGVLQGIQAGRVWEFDISQTWALGALVLMMIPAAMVALSLILPAAVNRWVNTVVAILYIAVGVGTSIGETWAFSIVGHSVGIVLLLCTIWIAVRWPREEG